MSKNISRRNFLSGAFATSAVAASGALFACSPAPEAEGAEEGGEAAAATGQSTRPNPGEGHPTRIDTYGPEAEPIEPLAAPADWDEEADVVVVGTGLGGLTAALYTLQGGLSVIAVEKDIITGGAGRHAANNHVNCGGTKAQNEVGYAWPGEKFDARDRETSPSGLRSRNAARLPCKVLVMWQRPKPVASCA